MGAGDHHRRDDKSRPIEQPSSAEVVDTANEASVEAEHLATVDDVWAASEGYTPLQDMQGGGGLFSDGGSTTFFTSYPGAFIADMGAFGDDDDADDDSSHQHLDCENVAVGSTLDQQQDSADFRSVADNALMMLEDEYRRTVSHQYHSSELQSESSLHENLASLSDANDDSPKSSEPFAPDFEDTSSLSGNALANRLAKVIPEIDAEAVRRAVQKIQLRDPKLKLNLQQWELAQKETAGAMAPRLHPIIPSAPLAAFRKRTAKAVQASANLSRSACIAEALRRFDVLQNEPGCGEDKTVRIHLVGCDHVECESHERLIRLFAPIVRWIGAYAEAPAHLHFDLIGPNMPVAATQGPSINLLPTSSAAVKDCLQSATLSCHCAVYEDWVSSSSASRSEKPDLAIAFNAGVWGYREWKSTIEYLAQQNQSIPFVVTAYTIREAEDDMEVIQAILGDTSRCVWEPEANAFASNQDRATINALPGRRYRENAAWQGWRL
jgi:hypothetical protein